MTVQRFRDQVNWPQVVAIGLSVAAPAIGVTISIQSQLAVIQEKIEAHVSGSGHHESIQRLNTLERSQDRTDQWKEEVIRRLDEIIARQERMERRR